MLDAYPLYGGIRYVLWGFVGGNDRGDLDGDVVDPIPSLSKTCFTSLGPSPLKAGLFDLVTLYELAEKPPLSSDAPEAENPRLATDGALSCVSAMLDMPCRPSSASRRSETPTPRLERLRL